MTGFFSTSTLVKAKKRPQHIAHCGSCGLHKHCFSPKMEPTGEGRKKILIVAEAPGAEEDVKGVQLIGRSGQLLRGFLKGLGVNLDKDCWKTNTVICRPQDNATPTTEQINACAPNLFKTIKQYNPTTIILLGGVAVQGVLGTLRDENISSRGTWLGWQIPHQDLNAWICPTYHPAYLLRKQDSLVERMMKDHLRLAIEASKSRPWKVVPEFEKEVEVITRPSKAVKLLELMEKKGGTIAFDYECNCLKPEYKESELVSCSVCWNGKRTIAYPWQGEAIEATANLLKSPIEKVACNLKFEHRWTKNKLGVTIRNWKWDTMLAAHVIDHRAGITSLKFQAFVLLGQKSYNDHIEPFLTSDRKKNHLNRIHEIDMKDLLLYNGMDALLEYKVAEKQMKVLGGK